MPTTKRVARSQGVPVLAARARQARTFLPLLKPGTRIVITTHVNADGDGTGSEIALWHMLTAIGVKPVIANPTPYPDRYRFLLEGAAGAEHSGDAAKQIARADAVIVLDIADASRIGHLAALVAARKIPVGCVDHHASPGSLPPGPRLVDAEACATGELICDLARALKWKLTPAVARALYVAILTDTGGFRFSNTTPRALRVAADLLQLGVNAEEIYAELYGNGPEGRVRLLSEVLETLVVEPEVGLAWVTVAAGAFERHQVDSDDLDGVVEFPRSIKGVRLALLFRPLANGRVKVSFRAKGGIDVAELAQQFGGGGHAKASGASLAGSLAEVQAKVLSVARAALA
jgi:phosphoesterase RecJ-like protein